MKKSVKPKKTSPASTAKTIPTTSFDYEKWFPWIAAAIGLLLYLNTINLQYALDDDTVLAKNTIVTQGIKAIPEIFTSPYRKGAWDRQESLYRPLSPIVFAIEWQIAPNHPFLGHLINILLYSLCCFLLYKLLRKWLRQKHPLVILAITLLFTVHPLHTEVIANIKSLDEILGLLFAVLALNSFYDYASAGQIKKLASGLLFFFLALLSKESSITLAAIIPLSVYFFSDPPKKKYGYMLGGIIICIACYFLLRKMALGDLVNFSKIIINNNALVATDNHLDRFATAIVYIGYYIRLFFFPHPLFLDYSYNTIPLASLSDYRFLLSMAALLAMVAYSIFRLKKKDPAAFGIIFFGITISIVSNIFILIEATMAERFMFIPSLGLCMFTILMLERIFNFSAKNNTAISFVLKQQKVFCGIVIAVLLLFSLKTFTRNFDWKNNFTLFSADKDHNPDSYRILSGYAMEFYNKNIFPLADDDPQKAAYIREDIPYLTKTLALVPNNFSAWNVLSYEYSQLHQYDSVIHIFQAGLQYHHGEGDFIKFYILALSAYYHTGNLKKCVETAKEALKVDSVNTDVLNWMGMSLTDLNERQDALDALNKALSLDSTSADTWYNVGNWHAKGGDYLRAIDCYAKALQIDPKHREAMNNMGNCYAILKQYGKALEIFQKILALRPGDRDALKNLAATYNNLGQHEKAIPYEEKLK